MSEIILPDGSRIPVENTEDVSDGYHTFWELYEHRCLLWAYLINTIGFVSASSFKTRKNDKGEEMEGWFIAGMNYPSYQITYHLPDRMWGLVNAPEIERNDRYDGHTSDDVLKRIVAILGTQI